MEFYRYEVREYASLGVDGDYASPKFPRPRLELITYNLHKETPKGYWIGYGTLFHKYPIGKSHWVSKTAKKRHAYPTKEEALVNFIKRTEYRSKILKWQLDVCRIAINLANQEQEKLKV